ncbi:MAG: hypothetical protein PHV18_02935 [Lachnospiraceae bacterium]|nr:hypothetical protein [Lachnospiraceae bacterium]
MSQTEPMSRTKPMRQTAPMRETALAGEEQFVRITQGQELYYGGDQAWFEFTVSQYGGCGTVAAANMTAYLAERNPALRALYRYPAYRKGEFLRHMEEVYAFVHPWKLPLVRKERPACQIFGRSFGWTFGVWPMSRFTRGVKRFACSRGVRLCCTVIHSRSSLETLTAWIRDSLKEDCPVAMLIGKHPKYERERVERPDGTGWHQTHFSMHWVVITRLREQGGQVYVKVSTWGGASWLDLRAWQQAGGFVPGLVRVCGVK